MRTILKWIRGRFRSFDYLPEYFHAVRLHFLDVTWGIGVGAAVPYMIYGLYSLFKTPTPLVNWLAIIGALFLAGYYLWRADHIRLIPQLSIAATRLQEMLIPVNNVRGHDVQIFCQIVPKCLTESPVYECRGHLKEVRRWAVDRWQVTDLGPLVLRWANTHEQEISLHPGAENVLNLCFITYSTQQVAPCVDADITWEKINNTFLRQPGGIEAYQFDISITYSHRVNGQLESVKPVNVCADLQINGGDFYHPHFDLFCNGSRARILPARAAPVAKSVACPHPWHISRNAPGASCPKCGLSFPQTTGD